MHIFSALSGSLSNVHLGVETDVVKSCHMKLNSVATEFFSIQRLPNNHEYRR